MSTSESNHSTVSKFDFLKKKLKNPIPFVKEIQRLLCINSNVLFLYEGMPVTLTVVRAEHMLTNRSIQVKCE